MRERLVWLAIGIAIGLIPVFVMNHGYMPHGVMVEHCKRYGIEEVFRDD